MAVKERKISKKDWNKVEEYVQSIYDERKSSSFRKAHEEKWTEIDRQIKMEPMERLSEKGAPLPSSWHNVLELGELSKASEIITSDVMRILFPSNKAWFTPHVSLKWATDPKTGQPKQDSKKQKVGDGLLRNLMSQQHKDFGFKDRFRLSIKEALHHGSFSAEVRFEKEMMVKDEGRIRLVGAPVWVPYSMWNAFPDPAPSVIGTNMFYTGSMVFLDYIPLWKLKKGATGDGWMKDRLKKVEKEEHKTPAGKTDDVEIIKFYGDISIERSDGDIFLPNAKVLIANGTLVYYASNDLPFAPVVYSGYERQDVRDPYYTSPIIKQSPIQKAASVTLNKFLDAGALKVEPPIEYDGNDPDYVANDGPVIAPGAKTPTKSLGKGMNMLDIGDPSWALKALEVFLRQMQEGTAVSALRSGTANSDRQTATEVNKVDQGSEIRTIEFIEQLIPPLGAFLYMQHELNRSYMDEYEFYNDELHTPDVIRAKKSDIQSNAYFEITGTKGLLGEEQRTQKTSQVTAFALSNPLTAGRIKIDETLMNMYRDAGNKNPEDFVKTEQGKTPQDAAKDAKMQEMMQMLQQLAQENKDLKVGHQVKMAQIQADNQQFMAEMKKDREQFAATFAEDRKQFQQTFALEVAEFKAEAKEKQIQSVVSINAGDEIGKVAKELKEMGKQQSDALVKAAETFEKAADKMEKNQGKKRKVKRTADGYEVE